MEGWKDGWTGVGEHAEFGEEEEEKKKKKKKKIEKNKSSVSGGIRTHALIGGPEIPESFHLSLAP